MTKRGQDKERSKDRERSKDKERGKVIKKSHSKYIYLIYFSKSRGHVLSRTIEASQASEETVAYPLRAEISRMPGQEISPI